MIGDHKNIPKPYGGIRWILWWQNQTPSVPPPPALFQARVFLQVVSSTLYFLIHTVSLPVSAKKIVVKIFQHWFPQLKKKKEEGIVRRWHCVCALEEHITTQPRFQDPISYFGHRNEVDLFRLKKNISVTSGSDITKGKTAPHYLHFKEFELD